MHAYTTFHFGIAPLAERPAVITEEEVRDNTALGNTSRNAITGM